MKKAAFIILIPILLMQMGGRLLIYTIQQYSVQNEMEQVLEDGETNFLKLTLSSDDYNKGKISPHEIFVDKKLYDVKSVKFSGDKVELLVVNDIKEENIIENISKSVNTGGLQSKEHPFHFVKVLNLLYIAPPIDNDLLFKATVLNVFQLTCETILSYKPGISSPPPRLV